MLTERTSATHASPAESQARRGLRAAPKRAFRPGLEPCEGRMLLSHARPHASIVPAAQTLAFRNPLAPYTTFDAAVQRGPHAGFVISGPIVLGQTDARGQVIGFVFQNNGPRLTVVGGIFGRRVSLRIILPQGGALQASGVGRLVRVAGGLPGGMALVGSGILAGPARNDVGAWFTAPPAPSAGA